MRMPAAEIDVNAELVQKLIMEQHPDLSAPLIMVANGWDNVIFRLGDDLGVRLPRRQVAAQLVINEQRWLPTIAASLPVRTPVPIRIGQPSKDFPWAWTIGPWLDGRSLIELPVADRSRFAPALAEFLAALHRPAPVDAPHNPVRGVPLADRASLAAEHLDSGLVPDADRLRRLWVQLLGTPAWAADPVWVHGDPHPANVLVSHDQLSAVIDFGDVNSGDPATDLAAGWLSFDVAGRSAFKARYQQLTGMDGDLWQRARGWALVIGMALVVNSDDHPQLAAVGRHALAAVLED
ncbi:aminoglycoside phosphotransferase family protein [Microlunatus elymi]|uniref:Aminoglycoside phosphotransferase family protein n=1 Tax=Microlunatus elymi TaxID=2596828 RepID=A0A516PWY2_9ACTN|nr:aminoglycoside phosphotransferase family protein [Microlunatus elymi]QDP95698.1 aminoglycoside phosphotransferase family protein [Microlunatus elymi]